MDYRPEPMKRTHLLSFAAVAALLAGCREQAKTTPEPAPSVALTPMGMASAATLVSTTNAVEVLTKLHAPTEIALGKDGLFVIDTPTDSPGADDGMDILSVPLTVGGSPKPLYRGQRGAEGLATANGRLVWITAPSDDKKEHAKIVSARPGAAAAPVVRTYDVDETLAASDGTDVFSFGDVKDPAKSKAHDPDVLRIGDSGKATVVATSAGQLVRTALAVNATSVLWVQGGAIVRAPKSGGEPTTVVKLPAGKIQRMAADDTAVYWTDYGIGDPSWSGRVYRSSLADGKAETLSDAASPFAIAVDADTVYWTSSADVGGRVLARKKAGGATFVLAKDLHGPRGITVDDKYVYWIDKGDGTVCRTEKAPHAVP